MFKIEYPDDAPAGGTWLDNINPHSLEVVADAKLEPSLADAAPGSHFQFERLGYFFTDPVDSKIGRAGLQSHSYPPRHVVQGGWQEIGSLLVSRP